MKKIQLTEKQQKIFLAVGFFLAMAVSIYFFSNAFLSMGMQDPGYYQIETETVEDALGYAQNYSFVYYLDGDSNTIKAEGQTLKGIYSAKLSRMYKLLDCENTYDGFQNLATLNGSLGQEVTINQELYQVLSDAWEKTRECRGFNLFAGALNTAWNEILVLSEPEEFDPAVDPQMESRLAALAEMTADLSQFDLDLKADGDNYTCKVTVSQEYLHFLEENEHSKTILDLGQLKDAYILAQLRDTIEGEGYCNGYLTAQSGLILNLSQHTGAANYQVYSLTDGLPVKTAVLPARANSAYCMARSFALSDGELGYYTVTAEGETYARHPWFAADSSFPGVLTMACAVSDDTDPVAAAYACIVLFNCPDKASVASFASGESMQIACAMSGEPEVLYGNAACAENIFMEQGKLISFGQSDDPLANE